METAELETIPAVSELSDRELLEGIYTMLTGITANVNETLVHVAPALDGLAKSPMGKMLGLGK